MSAISEPTVMVLDELERMRQELRTLRAELAQRRPVAWHVTNNGTAVLCSDGAVLWYDEEVSGEWSELPPVPGTPAASAQVPR